MSESDSDTVVPRLKRRKSFILHSSSDESDEDVVVLQSSRDESDEDVISLSERRKKRSRHSKIINEPSDDEVGNDSDLDDIYIRKSLSSVKVPTLKFSKSTVSLKVHTKCKEDICNLEVGSDFEEKKHYNLRRENLSNFIVRDGRELKRKHKQVLRSRSEILTKVKRSRSRSCQLTDLSIVRPPFEKHNGSVPRSKSKLKQVLRTSSERLKKQKALRTRSERLKKLNQIPKKRFDSLTNVKRVPSSRQLTDVSNLSSTDEKQKKKRTESVGRFSLPEENKATELNRRKIITKPEFNCNNNDEINVNNTNPKFECLECQTLFWSFDDLRLHEKDHHRNWDKSAQNSHGLDSRKETNDSRERAEVQVEIWRKEVTSVRNRLSLKASPQQCKAPGGDSGRSFKSPRKSKTEREVCDDIDVLLISSDEEDSRGQANQTIKNNDIVNNSSFEPRESEKEMEFQQEYENNPSPAENLWLDIPEQSQSPNADPEKSEVGMSKRNGEFGVLESIVKDKMAADSNLSGLELIEIIDKPMDNFQHVDEAEDKESYVVGCSRQPAEPFILGPKLPKCPWCRRRMERKDIAQHIVEEHEVNLEYAKFLAMKTNNFVMIDILVPCPSTCHSANQVKVKNLEKHMRKTHSGFVKIHPEKKITSFFKPNNTTERNDNEDAQNDLTTGTTLEIYHSTTTEPVIHEVSKAKLGEGEEVTNLVEKGISELNEKDANRQLLKQTSKDYNSVLEKRNEYQPQNSMMSEIDFLNQVVDKLSSSDKPSGNEFLAKKAVTLLTNLLKEGDGMVLTQKPATSSKYFKPSKIVYELSQLDVGKRLIVESPQLVGGLLTCLAASPHPWFPVKTLLSLSSCSTGARTVLQCGGAPALVNILQTNTDNVDSLLMTNILSTLLNLLKKHEDSRKAVQLAGGWQKLILIKLYIKDEVKRNIVDESLKILGEPLLQMSLSSLPAPVPAQLLVPEQEPNIDSTSYHKENKKHKDPKIPCKFWIKGFCQKGQDCSFHHQRRDVDVRIPEVCKFWLRGDCRLDDRDCRFIHTSQAERLRMTSNLKEGQVRRQEFQATGGGGRSEQEEEQELAGVAVRPPTGLPSWPDPHRCLSESLQDVTRSEASAAEDQILTRFNEKMMNPDNPNPENFFKIKVKSCFKASLLADARNIIGEKDSNGNKEAPSDGRDEGSNVPETLESYLNLPAVVIEQRSPKARLGELIISQLKTCREETVADWIHDSRMSLCQYLSTSYDVTNEKTQMGVVYMFIDYQLDLKLRKKTHVMEVNRFIGEVRQYYRIFAPLEVELIGGSDKPRFNGDVFSSYFTRLRRKVKT